MKVYAWLFDWIHRRKNCPRGWFPGGSKKWPNTAGQYSIDVLLRDFCVVISHSAGGDGWAEAGDYVLGGFPEVFRQSIPCDWTRARRGRQRDRYLCGLQRRQLGVVRRVRIGHGFKRVFRTNHQVSRNQSEKSFFCELKKFWIFETTVASRWTD